MKDRPELKRDITQKCRLYQQFKYLFKWKTERHDMTKVTIMRKRMNLMAEHLKQDDPNLLESASCLGKTYRDVEMNDKAIFYYEKFAYFSQDDTEFKNVMYACSLNYLMNKTDRLINLIKFARDKSVAFEAMLLNHYDYPYEQSPEDAAKALEIIKQGDYVKG